MAQIDKRTMQRQYAISWKGPFVVALSTAACGSASSSGTLAAEAASQWSRTSRQVGDAALAMPFTLPAGHHVSEPIRFWRDGRMLVTRSFTSRLPLPQMAAALAAQIDPPARLMTVPQGVLVSGRKADTWWSVHLHDTGESGSAGTIVGSRLAKVPGGSNVSAKLGESGEPQQSGEPDLSDASGPAKMPDVSGQQAQPDSANVTAAVAVRPPGPPPHWLPAGAVRHLDTRAADDTRCHIQQVLTFPMTAAALGDAFDRGLDRAGWTRDPGPRHTGMARWQRTGSTLDLVVVATEAGSGAVLHRTELRTPFNSAGAGWLANAKQTATTSAASNTAAATLAARAFALPSANSTSTESPCEQP